MCPSFAVLTISTQDPCLSTEHGNCLWDPSLAGQSELLSTPGGDQENGLFGWVLCSWFLIFCLNAGIARCPEGDVFSSWENECLYDLCLAGRVSMSKTKFSSQGLFYVCRLPSRGGFQLASVRGALGCQPSYSCQLTPRGLNRHE